MANRPARLLAAVGLILVIGGALLLSLHPTATFSGSLFNRTVENGTLVDVPNGAHGEVSATCMSPFNKLTGGHSNQPATDLMAIEQDYALGNAACENQISKREELGLPLLVLGLIALGWAVLRFDRRSEHLAPF